jgi:hypothetical protein
MGAYVDGRGLFGDDQLFRGYKAYWECHRDALFSSSIQAHLTRVLQNHPCRGHWPASIAHVVRSSDF